LLSHIIKLKRKYKIIFNRETYKSNVMQSRDIVVVSEVGLHAKPADLFVRAANAFASDIRIMNLTRQSQYENAKSILKVLSLGIYKNHTIRIMVKGADESEAIRTLSRLVESDFAAEIVQRYRS